MVNYAKIAGAAGYGKKRKESSSAKKKRQEAVKKYKESIPKSKKPIDTSYTSKAIGPVSSGLPVKAIANPSRDIRQGLRNEQKKKPPFAKTKTATKIVSPVMSATRSNLGRVTKKSTRRQKYLNILQRNREQNAKLKKPSIIGTLNKYILGPKTQIKTKLLTGGQAKIDKDGDGKITGNDFKILNKSKKKEGGVTSAIKKIRGIGMAKGGFKKKTPIY